MTKNQAVTVTVLRELKRWTTLSVEHKTAAIEVYALVGQYTQATLKNVEAAIRKEIEARKNNPTYAEVCTDLADLLMPTR